MPRANEHTPSTVLIINKEYSYIFVVVVVSFPENGMREWMLFYIVTVFFLFFFNNNNKKNARICHGLAAGWNHVSVMLCGIKRADSLVSSVGPIQNPLVCIYIYPFCINGELWMWTPSNDFRLQNSRTKNGSRRTKHILQMCVHSEQNGGIPNE